MSSCVRGIWETLDYLGNHFDFGHTLCDIMKGSLWLKCIYNWMNHSTKSKLWIYVYSCRFWWFFCSFPSILAHSSSSSFLFFLWEIWRGSRLLTIKEACKDFSTHLFRSPLWKRPLHSYVRMSTYGSFKKNAKLNMIIWEKYDKVHHCWPQKKLINVLVFYTFVLDKPFEKPYLSFKKNENS